MAKEVENISREVLKYIIIIMNILLYNFSFEKCGNVENVNAGNCIGTSLGINQKLVGIFKNKDCP